MSKPVSNLRLFVGLYPPPDVVAALRAILDGLTLPGHRPTPAEQVHMTLQFIGDTPAGSLEGVMESVMKAAAGISEFPLGVERLITLPQRGPARLVAAETDRPAELGELHDRLARRLARAPRRRPGDRFRPHLTLCRFRSPTRLDPLELDLDGPMFRVDRLALMRSTLRADGAHHQEVGTVALERRGRA